MSTNMKQVKEVMKMPYNHIQNMIGIMADSPAHEDKEYFGLLCDELKARYSRAADIEGRIFNERMCK